MIMDEIIREIMEGQDGGTPQTLVYADDISYMNCFKEFHI
jgi:hypothetical protein